jgi:hypothetical protein
LPGQTLPKRLNHTVYKKRRNKNNADLKLSGLYYLEDVKVPETIKISQYIENDSNFNVFRNFRIRLRHRDLNLIPIEIKELQRDDVIIWNPDGSPIPEESYLAKIQATFVHFNVLNQPKYYAQFKIVSFTTVFQNQGCN